MAVGVVELLEVVHVQQDQHHADAVAAGLGQFTLGGQHEGAAVRQTCQEVGVRQRAQALDQSVALLLQRLACADLRLQRAHRADDCGHLVVGVRCRQRRLQIVAGQRLQRASGLRQRLQQAALHHQHRRAQHRQQHGGTGCGEPQHRGGLPRLGVGACGGAVQQQVAQAEQAVHVRHIGGGKAARVQAVAAVALAGGHHPVDQRRSAAEVGLAHLLPGLLRRGGRAGGAQPQVEQAAQLIDAAAGALDGGALVGAERLLRRQRRGEVRTQQAGVFTQFGRHAGALHVVAQRGQGLLGFFGRQADRRRDQRHHRHHVGHALADLGGCALCLGQCGQCIHRRAGAGERGFGLLEVACGVGVPGIGRAAGQHAAQRGKGGIGAAAGFGQALAPLRLGRAVVTQHAIGGAALARHHLGGRQGLAQVGHGHASFIRQGLVPALDQGDARHQHGGRQGEQGSQQAQQSGQ